MAHLQERSSPPSETMKHEEPRTIPSSRGHPGDISASASAAAALGWAKHKPLETKAMPQDSISSSAARAASLAADQRPSSSRGQARSASAFPQTLRSGSPSAGLGSSAAAQAYKARSPHLAPEAAVRDSPSLLAAKEAVGATRPRSISSPVPSRPVPDQASGDGDEPRHETATQRWKFTPGPGPAGDIPVPTTTLPRAMFTANPPVDQEVEEKKKADELHASAVEMAKNMFKKQPKLAESFLREDDLHEGRETAQSDGHSNLHETAYKLALERLANVHRQNQKDEEARSHHAPSGGLRRRFTIGGRFQGRASSTGDLESRQKDKASHRASLLAPKQTKPDEGRESDQSHVLAAAQRNVRSQLDDMDESIADRTGMAPPSTKSAWESRARSVAQGKAAAAVDEPRDGRRDVGGGLHVAQDDVDAVARRNLKPLFHEIDERAERERDRRRSLKEERLLKEVEAEKKAAYDKEVNDLHRKLKAEQKEKEKERQKALKEEERARKREEKAGKRRRRSSTVIIPEIDIGSSDPAHTDEAAAGQEIYFQDGSHRESSGPRRTSRNADDGGGREQSSPGKFRSWFRTKFTRQKPASRDREDSDPGRSFMGGRALRSPEPSTGDAAPSSSMRDVALAGRISHPHLEQARARTPSRGDGSEAPLEREVSSGTDDPFEDARESISTRMTPPPQVGAKKSGSPTRDSRFVEMMD